MPGRYEFPGGRLEDADFHKTPVLQLNDKCIDAMGHLSSHGLAYPLLNCAIRVLTLNWDYSLRCWNGQHQRYDPGYKSCL